MKKIRILANVNATDHMGNPSVAMPAGSLHDETPDALRQLAIGNAEVVDVAEDAAPAAAPAEAAAPAAEAAADAAPAKPARAMRAKA